MEENKEEVNNTLVETKGKQVPYESASESCNDLGSVVPRNLSQESTYFNRFLKTDIDVAKFVQKKLHYNSVEDLCKAFVKEQIDAIATSIWNFEQRDFGLIVSDQTGLGKGRIVAGLIRYSILELGKMPVFFTEKTTLFSDIYRDLFDIGLDAGIPIMRKKATIDIDIDLYTDEKIIKIIKKDIKGEDGEFRVDFDLPDEIENLKDIFDEENEELLEELIELYRQDIAQNGETKDDGYDKVSIVEYNKQVQEATKSGKMLVKPFAPFTSDGLEIKDKTGNIIYKNTVKEVKNIIDNNEIPGEYKLLCLMYSTIRRIIDKKTGQISSKFKLIQKYCNNAVLILDEAHNAAGKSNTFQTMTTLLNSAKSVAYVSATWAKRPDNMPLYGIKTAIKEAFLSTGMLVSAFENGDLALQESTSAGLVKIGQLLRREKLIECDTTYYYENNESTAGKTQISKLDRVSTFWKEIQDFEKIVKDEFYKQLTAHGITKKDEPDEYKKYRFGVSVAARTFELFNYFLLSLKVEQSLLEANRQLQNGKKVIISISNTLESAFSNIKKDYIADIPYEVGDVIPNDFTQVLGYLLSSVMRFKYEGEYTNDEGQTELIDRKIQILTLTPEQMKSQATYYKIARRMSDVLSIKFENLLNQIISNPIGLSLAPIDQIKQSLAISGFSAEEITGRGKYIQFEVTDGNMLNLEEGVITRREKKDKVDIINAFNSNELDCLIINQSGSTGVSMHAVPTTEQGKIVAPVNVVPEIPPTSLEPRNEVKQRAMIILQMELDINKEVQKLGRINRTGQVFPPIYRYIVSAIPSEARLSAMMQKKLKSLMANTSGSQEQGDDMFNSDDLFSKNAVEPFNETVISLKYSGEYMVKTAEDVYKNTKKFYFVSYEAQQKFYELLSANLKKHIEKLREKGQYFGAIEYQEYAAQTKQIIPFIIGNNNAFTEFGGHVFAEVASCQVFDQKNTETDIKRAISLGLSLNAEGRVIPYNTKEDYYNAVESTSREFVNTFVEVSVKPDLRYAEEQLQEEQLEKEELLTKAAAFENLTRILEIDERLSVLEREKEDNKKIISDFLEVDDLVSARPYSRKTQQIVGEINVLVEERKKYLNENEDITSLQRQQKSFERDLKTSNNNIEYFERKIEKYNQEIVEQERLRDLLLQYIKNIGNVYTIKRFSESVQHVEEDEDTLNPYINVYNEIYNEQAVLVSAKFNQNNNAKLLPGQIELIFKDVTSNIELNVYNLDRPLNEIELQKKAQLVDQVFNKNIVYNDYWDNYIKNISTGRETDKIFLSGNLLRGMAFQNIVGVTGKIVKYNSFDKKLLTSLELDKESTKRLMPRFNEKVNFSLLAGLNEDNLKNLIIPCLISQMGYRGSYRTRQISSQIYLDTTPTFLECYFTNKSGNELAEIVYEKWSKESNEAAKDRNDWYDEDENGKTPNEYYLEKFNKEFTRPLIMENIQKLRFNFTSVSRGVIKFLESIAMSMGAEAPEHNGNISEIAWLESDMYNSGKYASTIQYSAKGDFKKDTKKQEPFLNEVYNSRSRKFDYKLSSDNNLLEGIYISSASIISDRASSSGKEYFIGTYNLVMTYETLVAVINYLEKAKNTQILATTSNDVLLMAEPPYVFSQTSSAMGVIDENEGVEIVDNVGEMSIVSIEDIINDFVNIYNN